MFVPKKMRLNDFEEVIIPTPRELCNGSVYNLPEPPVTSQEETLPPSMSKTDLLMYGQREAAIAAHKERQRQAAAQAAASGAKNDGEGSAVHQAAAATE